MSSTAELILVSIGVALMALTLISVWGLGYQLIKQQGRLLLRLDSLEASLGTSGSSRPDELPVGAPVQPFDLPDLTGGTIGLDRFHGRRVLLVHWSPHCPFCEQIAGDLAKAHAGLLKSNAELVLVSHGRADENRKLLRDHGLGCPLVLVDDGSETPVFGSLGTPVAYLLDEQGRVARPVAVGADQVAALARSSTVKTDQLRSPLDGRPVSSRIERDGLKAGSRAPTFSLPDISGRTVSLLDYRGRRALLVFSDPQCGPCDQLVPDLVRLHGESRDNGLGFVMIGRGDVDENRRKAVEHGVTFPVVVQRHWQLSRDYGIFETPVAFLVGEDGLIARDVARGRDEILALAEYGMPAGEEAHVRVV